MEDCWGQQFWLSFEVYNWRRPLFQQPLRLLLLLKCWSSKKCCSTFHTCTVLVQSLLEVVAHPCCTLNNFKVHFNKNQLQQPLNIISKVCLTKKSRRSRNQRAALQKSQKSLWVISDIINFTSFYTMHRTALFLKSVKKEMKNKRIWSFVNSNGYIKIAMFFLLCSQERKHG